MTDTPNAFTSSSESSSENLSSPPAGSPPPPDRSSSMAEIDREVAEAMASMDAADLADLTGGPAPNRGRHGATVDEVAPGTELTGTVCGVTEDDVFLQLGVKSQGMLPRSQFGKKEPIENGRKVDVVVDRFDAEAGLLIVSRKGEAQRATWTNLKPDMIVEGKVTGMNKGGLEVNLNGIRAFMPASQVDVIPSKDISQLLNHTIKAIILEVDRRGRNVLVSRRKYMEKERAEQREAIRAELQPGQLRKGIVSNVTEFGAFVDLGGVDGLVHIRDISWSNVDKVSDVLKPGQEVEVVVLKINKDRDRISLGMKQMQPDPWDKAADRYPVDTRLKVRIVRIADFGAFAELEPGVDGLIPVSEMSWTRIRTPAEVMSVGDMVDAVVIRVEADKKRLALSMKQASADPWSIVLDSYPPGSMVHGKITRLAEFGAFVELVPGVEGMIHISEMSDKRIKTCSEVVKPDDEVEARVLGVDREKRRISLSLRPVHAPMPAGEHHAAPAEHAPPKPAAKKRKKALRGGLAGGWDWAGDLKFNMGPESSSES